LGKWLESIFISRTKGVHGDIVKTTPTQKSLNTQFYNAKMMTKQCMIQP
jgi:hypothetical protein